VLFIGFLFKKAVLTQLIIFSHTETMNQLSEQGETLTSPEQTSVTPTTVHTPSTSSQPPLPPSQSIPSSVQEIVTASRKRRFANYLIDRVLSISLGYVVITLIAVILGLLHISNPNTGWIIALVGFLPTIFLYYFLGERILGRTLGKYITSTQVIDNGNQLLTSSQIIKRTFARLIPFDELSIFNHNRTTWHDRLSGTRVVPSKPLLPEKQPPLNKTLRFVTIILILLLPGGVLGYEIYQSTTGGERFQLPQPMPDGLHLTSFQTLNHGDTEYYVLTYTGNSQVIQIMRLIAGYDFDPAQNCGYMEPTYDGVVGTPISKDLTCTKIGKTVKFGFYDYAYQVTSTATDPSIQQITPDFYLDVPPYRYMIKATSGTITRNEVLQMLNNLSEVTQQHLQAQLNANQGN
jgi:uncharacterized RDD family membrane protein YckC